ncbi:MAG: 4Fe-4S binding protein, partial [Candidatus Acidiferrales bacterium]
MGERVGKEPARGQPAASEEAWVTPVRWFALAVFIALPVFAFLVPRLAGRVVWTVAIALLPLFIVLGGYHAWRRACPLAWFAQLPARLGLPGERRASPWLQANYYYIVFSFFILSLWLRLVATNGDGPALGGFLVLLSLAALLIGALYTGKTWCNYLCPVSFVEKIYTEPRGLRPTPNSQCVKCTACKPSCPDINQENGYWKEILSQPKRLVYFAFPGLIFSFYFYYYLHAGTWEYYFGGAWTDEPGVLRTAFLPGFDARTAGFYFLPAVPRAAAALLTLVLGALLSYGVFAAIERVSGSRLRKRGGNLDESALRHLLLTVTAFAAFITFYTFAGAPTIRLVSGAPHLFQILVVATGTLFLARRFTRRQQAFAEETLARQIIRRWEWTDTKPPEDLREALVLHTIRSQTQASGYVRLLEVYKEAVREAVTSGFVSRAEVQRLESLRNQLQISQADHEKIMADLAEEERARIADPVFRASAEKRLQLESYAQALQSYLERVSRAGAAPNDSVIRHLRQEYAVTPEEHAAVLDDLLGKGQGIAAHVSKAFEVGESAVRTFQFIGTAPSAAGAFLADVLARKQARAVDDLMRGFGCDPEDESFRNLRARLLSHDEVVREAAVEALGAHVGPAVAVRLREARREAARAA